ncbi:Putative SOS response-associated peptidase YedK [Noviherbaspirillum humi]|uniref:Abasic site processing protein n=2 Tax=Noviherbaspirillum humi TaxID=1688639 RepID=A0A239F8S8_9BURK|nr:SOS response-associated peptidase family protein [Noviherbaspirillum humi]SNS53319.1 Putative SOS response-associated peptidase YedK [Noviherbaspirillum humi]
MAAYYGVAAPPSAAFSEEAYPASMAPILRLPSGGEDGGGNECVAACFGMVPHWADPKLAKHTYNARSETVASKPSFRHAFRRRQFCVIPADDFFEPCYESGKAVRWQIAHADGRPLSIAGIWDYRPATPDADALVSFSMLTINADDHPLMRRFHRPEDEKRMLVLLRDEDIDSWLHAPLEQVPSFLTPYPADALVAKPAPRPTARRSRERDGGVSGSLF